MKRTSFLAIRSIRFRLTALYAGILTVTLALAGVYVFYAVRMAARNTVDSDLRSRLGAVRETLSREFDGTDTKHLGDEIEGHAAAAPAGVWLALADTQGHWIHRSKAMKNGEAKPPSIDGLAASGKIRTVDVDGKPMRVLTAPVSIFIVQIGMPMEPFGRMLKQLRWTLGISVPPLLLLACIGGYWLSGRALRPVDEIAQTVQRIGSRNLAERLTLRGTGDELDRLAATMNQMLSRIDSAFRLVTRLTADASHELRTPVAIIRTTGEVIRSTKRTTEEHEIAWDQVLLQAERMSSLIDDLLLLARADAGHSQPYFESVDLAEVLRFAIGDIRILAETARIKLTVSVLPECFMSGDADALRRLLMILLDNAIKYTDAGGEVSVLLDVDESAERHSAMIEVRDTGVGIGPDDLPRVFDRFYRVSTDRSRQTGGSGLGLSIAQWLASLHGGRIAVTSDLGKGSTFRVTLPL
jgi:heavy metal sensor kinase